MGGVLAFGSEVPGLIRGVSLKFFLLQLLPNGILQALQPRDVGLLSRSLFLFLSISCAN